MGFLHRQTARTAFVNNALIGLVTYVKACYPPKRVLTGEETMKYLFGIAAAAALVPASAMAQVVDGSFEAQGAGNSGSFCYFNAPQFGQACSAGAWTGGGVTSGLQDEANPNFPGAPTPEGRFYAFIQSGYGAPGSITQRVTLGAGQFVFNWLDAGRPGSMGDQGYNLFFNGVSVFTGATTTGQAFTARTSGIVTLAGGTYDLTFQALDSGGDNSAFIDGVSVAAAVPEAATWGMMILGFGAMGFAMRRRAKVRTNVSFA